MPKLTRRHFVKTAAMAVPTFPTLAFSQKQGKTFRLWATGDPHVGTDLRKRKGKPPRESLAEALRQVESDKGFEWDAALCVGDFSGSQGIPDDDEGREVIRQFGTLTRHRREQFYCLAGNHDASPDNWWFRKWIDPVGVNTPHSGVDPMRRPHPVEGTWERYSFRIGNLLFLMMSDRNDYEPPVGCIRNGKGHGGRPPGAVTRATFEWWQRQVEENPDSIIISCHHHMLKETTANSGAWEAFRKDPKTNKWRGHPQHPHGYFQEDGEHNKGAGYLYWLVDDRRNPMDAKPDAQAFESYLASHPGAIDLWIGGHSHMRPNTKVNGRSHIERKWKTNFVNCSALTRYHAGLAPMSRLLTFTEGRTEVSVQCYLHTSDFAPQGWYADADRVIRLNKPFEYG